MIHITEPITFITGNAQKALWTQRYIHVPMTHKKLDLEEIQSLDPREVVEHKVRQAYQILQKPVLVEDTSVTIHALGRLPGPFIKFFLEELGNQGICNLITSPDRSAVAKVIFGVYNGTSLHLGVGSIEGTITKKPLGDDGFGWNPIFIPRGQTKTYAQLSKEEFDKISIRRKAIENLKEHLEYHEK